MKRRDFISTGIMASAVLGIDALAKETGPTKETRKKFSDRVVLITGATSGIGEATARAFAEDGASVVFCGRRVELGKSVEASIREKGGKATFVRADVREEQDMKMLVAKCKELHGRLDIAFNNAGIAPGPKALVDTTFDDMMNVMKTNFFGILHAMKYEIPLLLASGGGAIINTGSASATHGSSEFAPYVSSKHAMTGLTKVAALELATKNISVNSIDPHNVATPMLERRAKMLKLPIDKLAVDMLDGKMVPASEIAKMVMFLASQENRVLHGQQLDLSKGAYLRV